MSHLPSTTAIARTLLLAGILLAVTVLAARSFFPAFAHDDGTVHIHYDEGDTSQVTAFAATDEDGDGIDWLLSTTTDSSPDFAVFDISQQGVLTFKTPPDYEMPRGIGNNRVEQNSYTVVVFAKDDADVPAMDDVTVRVFVENIDEPGTIELSTRQPKETFEVTATLTDDDEQRDTLDTTSDTTLSDDPLLDDNDPDNDNVKWQWARCSTMEGDTCVDIEEMSTSTSYRPVEADRGHYLRVTAKYADKQTTDPEAGEELKLDKTASAMSEFVVLREDYEPAPPLFPGQAEETTTTANVEHRQTEATTTRDIAENSPVGTVVGAPVVAMDEGADGNQEVLTYTIVGGADINSYEIDGATGQLRVGTGANLNIEAPPSPDTTPGQPPANASDNVVVRATDPTDKYADVTVTINVTEVDENPIVTTGDTTHDVNENSHLPTPTLTLGNAYTAWDPEEDTIEWSVTGTDRARFIISPTGQLSFKEAPNYESPTDSGRNNSYDIAVTAADSKGKTGSRNVTVNVRPVPETGSITLSNRGARVGTPLTATLTDDDRVSGRVTWTWSGNGTSTEIMGGLSNTFTPHSGYEGSGDLTITAGYNDGDADDQTAEIEVTTGVQENATPTTPFWETSGGQTTRSVEVTVDENQAAGTPVSYDATAMDDGDTVFTYSISGSDSSAFRFNETNGTLTTGTMFDHERKASYNVTINVKNRLNRSASLSVRVIVGDEDESPVFTAGATSTEYAEGSRGSHRVDTYTATDPEGENVTLTLQPGGDATAFNFERGILSFINAPDFESGQGSGTFSETYSVIIRASDGSSTNVDLPVVITVTNVDEPGEVKLDALAPKNGVSLQATLTDPDTTTPGVGSQLWTWSNSPSRTGPWATSTGSMATTTTGTNEANYTPDENDVGKFLRALVTYTDGQSGTPPVTKMAEAVSTHVVRDVDYANTAPIFPGQEMDDTPAEMNRPVDSNATTSREIAENSPAGTRVGEAVSAVDLDESRQQQVLTYSKVDADTNADWPRFDLARSSGQITVAQGTMLNYDVEAPADRMYTVTVMATDPSGLTSMSEVTIMVTNVKEPPEIAPATTTPDMANLAEIKTPESIATTSLTSYTAADDEDDDIRLKWSWSGADEDMFVLCVSDNTDNACGDVNDANSSSPTVYLWLKPTDYENPADSGGNNMYDVTVTVTDLDRDMPQSDSRNVVVEVENMEEPGTVTLSNRQPEVDVPISASLSDPDGGVTGISWKWEFSEAIQECGDVNPTNGWSDLRAASSPSYTPIEDDDGRCLRATATYTDNADVEKEDVATTGCDESKGEDCDDQVSAFPVQAKPTTNATPQFADENDNVAGNQTVRYIEENSDVGATVVLHMSGTTTAPTQEDDYVTATDADTATPKDELTYTIGGRDASSFEIASSTGEVTVAKGADLNFETKNTYTVVVTATDSSLASDSITVTINVVDMNEAPVIMERGLNVSGPSSVTHPENSTAVVGSYSATGPDSAGATLRLEGTDSSLFTLARNGELTFNSAPDFEAPADQGGDNTYNVTVRATMGTLEDTQRVTITVGNVDEDGEVTISSTNDEVKVGVELTAELGDGDEIVAGSVTWQWARDASDTGSFSDVIAGETDNTYTPVDADVGSFLRATATYADSHGSGMTEFAVTGSAVLAATGPGTPGSVSLSSSSSLVSGDSVSATLTDADNPTNQVWQWDRSANGSTGWTTISGATSNSYTTTNDDGGYFLRASVTYDDSSGTGQTAGPVSTTGRVAINSYDADANGVINSTEVLTAVAEYFTPNSGVTVQEVLAVVQLYFAGLTQ